MNNAKSGSHIAIEYMKLKRTLPEYVLKGSVPTMTGSSHTVAGSYATTAVAVAVTVANNHSAATTTNSSNSNNSSNSKEKCIEAKLRY